MTTRKFTLVADFNAANLRRYLAADPSMSDVDIVEAPYGPVLAAMESVQVEPDVQQAALIWARPEAVIAGFQRALASEDVRAEDCLAEVDLFASAVLEFAARQQHCFVTAFALSPDHRGYGLLDWRPGVGQAHLLAQMNLRLAERLSPAANVFMLDAERWIRSVPAASAPKLWYAAKIPYTNAVFQRATSEIVAALAAAAGTSRRLIILDLDHTLWGGVVGETGWEGLRLGGHDFVGEAYRAFQAELKALTRRGIQLAIVSKNEEDVALTAITKHPEMVLRQPDFAGWRINWQDKAQNILDLLAELRLGASSAVFIDDNPVERDRVRAAVPEMLVPEWPDDPALYVQALSRLNCFDTAVISDEDRTRSQMYAADRSRRSLLTGSLSDWLTQLGTRMTVQVVSSANLPRVGQLFNKTNQLNLATRRLTPEQLTAWAEAPNRTLLAFSVADKFGDLGLTGVVSVEVDGEVARVVDYLLSCRVMGRKVEETAIHVAVEIARRAGARTVIATFRPTDRNTPTLKVLRDSGLVERSPLEFSWDCTDPFPKPPTVAVEWP
jgi:FkbH-like protein